MPQIRILVPWLLSDRFLARVTKLCARPSPVRYNNILLCGLLRYLTRSIEDLAILSFLVPLVVRYSVCGDFFVLQKHVSPSIRSR